MTRLYISPPVAGVSHVGTEPVLGRTEYVRADAWEPIETAPRDGIPFIATAMVSNTIGQRWRETHLIWCDDETGEIDASCEQGWQVDDYECWQPLPPPPLAKESDQ